MGQKKIYDGNGTWSLSVQMPEQLARKVQAIVSERGCTLAEITRAALFEYVTKQA